MSNNIAANPALPPFTPAAATVPAPNGPVASPATTDIGSTFLSLLVKELQNQDPTAPVDSTAMVGQIISLNQLDQLIAIKQTLAGPNSTTTTATANAIAAPPAASTAPLSTTTAAVLNSLPFDPNTMMPLVPNAAAVSAASLNSSFNSPLNAATMGFTGSR
ncbi:MAG: flagellar hook capping protein [Acidobacteriota bacterium]|nr:flagellar hook capping protein [Acidobacteriota bacterium]